MPKNGYIKLSWQGIHEEYIIEYSLDGVNWMPLARTKEKSYLHTNLDPNQIYHYRVWGVMKGQKSSIPAQISGYARDTIPPSPPVISSLVGIPNGFILKLQTPAESDWAGVEIYASTSPSFGISPEYLLAKGSDLYYEFNNLSGNTTYYLKIRYYDKSGNFSDITNAQVLTQTGINTIPPAVPQGLSLSTFLEAIDSPLFGKYPACIKATWNANTEDDFGGYELRIRRMGTSDYTTVQTRETSYTFKNLLPATSYGIQIRAYDIWGNYSNWSSESTITTAGDTQAPPAPSSITATGYFKIISVRWSTVSASDLAGYELHGNQTPNFTPSTSTLLYTGLSNSYTFTADVNQTWYFKVRCYDTSGNYSSFTPEVSASTVQIGSSDIGNNVITADMIQAGAITTEKIQANAITSEKIQAGAITTDKIASYSITAEKIESNAITSEKIASNSILTRHLSTDSVSLQALDLDGILWGFGTSFETDSNNDGIPDGWITQNTEYGGIVTTFPTSNYNYSPFRGGKGLLLRTPTSATQSVFAIFDKMLPLVRHSRPYFVRVWARRVQGDGMLYFIIRQYDINKNYLESYSRAFNGISTNWGDFIFQVNAGSLILNPNTAYVKIGFGLTVGTSDTIVLVDDIVMRSVQISPDVENSFWESPNGDGTIIFEASLDYSIISTPLYLTLSETGKFFTIKKIMFLEGTRPIGGSTFNLEIGLFRIGGRETYFDFYQIWNRVNYSDGLYSYFEASSFDKIQIKYWDTSSTRTYDIAPRIRIYGTKFRYSY